MKKIIGFIWLLCVVFIGFASAWQPDILGDGFEKRYVAQGTDYSGPVRSTIIRKKSVCGGNKGVLYVHGYNDYFFQDEMANRFVDSCINFYAVDLRKYGRSLMDGQKKFQVRNMREYFADIDSAIAQMERDGINDIVLMGHSTGGLTTSLYALENHNPRIKGLILNSPFLDWNFTGFMRKFAIPAFGTLGKLFPNISMSQSGSGYQQSLLKGHHGEWDYNQDWKVYHPEDVSAGWVNAISSAQKTLQKNPDKIDVPILLMHSSGSLKGGGWNPEFQKNDVVLNVDHIVERGTKLGKDVTNDTVANGIHDLFLSEKNVREKAYADVFNWLRNIHFTE